MYKKIFAFFFAPMLSQLAYCQVNNNPLTKPDSLALQEVTVTAHKFKERKQYVAQPIITLNSASLDNTLSNNTGSLLEQTGQVFVQKSQLGGGSPILRGFEASRVLLVIDGVRMNNAIYRTGHLQNVITIDDDIIDEIEILQGPSSTLYGSDALGGVIHFKTLQPQLSTIPQKLRIHTKTSGRYSSAYQEYTGNVMLNIGGGKNGHL
jgi:hemoglobin/transferrin/lactoferrin receptor protein